MVPLILGFPYFVTKLNYYVYPTYCIEHEVPNLKDLNSRVIPHHAVRWKNIGIELGLVPSLLDSISENCATKPQKCQECLYVVLEKWLMQDGSKATWSKLEHAITNVQRAELVLDPLEMGMFINSSLCS